MLAAISGSQGTGKSTLISALQPHFQVITRKTSRSILTDWNVTLSEVNNNHDLTIKFQDEILSRKLADEAEAAADPYKTYLTERTYADLFVYALVALGKENQYSDWLDEYYERCTKAQDTYNSVFYLSAGHFNPVHDGVRGSNKHYSHLVDMVMLDYTIEMCGTSKQFRIVNTPSIDERVSLIRSYIK